MKNSFSLSWFESNHEDKYVQQLEYTEQEQPKPGQKKKKGAIENISDSDSSLGSEMSVESNDNGFALVHDFSKVQNSHLLQDLADSDEDIFGNKIEETIDMEAALPANACDCLMGREQTFQNSKMNLSNLLQVMNKQDRGRIQNNFEESMLATLNDGAFTVRALKSSDCFSLQNF